MKKIPFPNVQDATQEIDLKPILWPFSFWTRVFQVPFRLVSRDDAIQNKSHNIIVKHLPFMFNLLFFLLCLIADAIPDDMRTFISPTTMTGSWNENIAFVNFIFRVTLTHLVLLIVAYFCWPKLSDVLREMLKRADGEIKKEVFFRSLLAFFFVILVKQVVELENF